MGQQNKEGKLKNTYIDNDKLNQDKIHFEQAQPKVSVGLLVYNGGKHLRGALDSLLAQTFDNTEIIISDNASTDNTQFICQEYAKKYHNIRYIRQAKNMGPIYNFKFVLAQASGEYFMWASHDDQWAPNYISECLKIFEDNPDCVSVFCHMALLDLNTKTKSERNTPTSCSSPSKFIRVATRLFEMIPNIIYSLHKTEIIRKAKIVSIDWFDVFITAQLSYYGKILIIPQYLYLAGIDGPRKPYSITGNYLTLSKFRSEIFLFIKDRFPIRHRIIFYLFIYYITIKEEKGLKKAIDNWNKP